MFQLAACYVLSFYSSSHLLAPISTLTFELYINPEYANSANLVATKCLYISHTVKWRMEAMREYFW